MVYNWLKLVRSSPLFVDSCELCGAPTRHPTGLCPACLADLPVIEAACPRCASPRPAHRVDYPADYPPGDPAPPCGNCQRHPPQFDAARIPFAYAPPLSGGITRLKFHARLAAARLLGELLVGALQADPPDRPDGLLPVPLHWRRLRQRGFNQALEIARPVARRLRLPVSTRHVIRRLDTRPQSDLDRQQRRRNLQHAFAMVRPLPWRHVAILDDVVTTGNTVDALAALLRQHGVERIQVWAVARA